jgi:hypothetical protein
MAWGLVRIHTIKALVSGRPSSGAETARKQVEGPMDVNESSVSCSLQRFLVVRIGGSNGHGAKGRSHPDC